MLDVGHGVEGHADCRDDDEGDGDAGDDFSCHGSVGLLYEIPKTDLVFDKLSTPEILFNLWENSTSCLQTENLSHLFLNIVGFFLHLLDNVFLPCVVFILTAGFQVNLNNYVLITFYSFLTTCSSMLCK